jgi:hypothetical protein
MNIIEENAYTTIESLSETILNKEVFENILLISSTLATVNEDYRSLYDILRMTHTLKNDVYVPLDLFTLSDYTLTPELFDEVPLLRRYKVRDGSDTKEYEREDGTKYINTTNYVREKIYRNDPRVLRGEVKPNVDMNGNWLPLPLEVIDGNIQLNRATDQKRHRALHGLYRSLVNNMVTGVTQGYKKRQELVGVGYKATNEGNILDLTLGYSHHIYFEIPSELTVKTEQDNARTSAVKRLANPCVSARLLNLILTY